MKYMRQFSNFLPTSVTSLITLHIMCSFVAYQQVLILISKYYISFIANSFASGVARVPCALGQEIFLHSLSTKTAEFKVKNKCKVKYKIWSKS